MGEHTLMAALSGLGQKDQYDEIKASKSYITISSKFKIKTRTISLN